MTSPSTQPNDPGFFTLLKTGGRWWMWGLIAATGLAVLALVTLQALEYVAPFFYVAL